jgi:hypothetical protein
MSMSSEKRSINANDFDNEVPPLKSKRGESSARPLNRTSRVQQTQKSFSTF